jgi:hypothetical protein
MTAAKREQDPDTTPPVDLHLGESQPDALEFGLTQSATRRGVPMAYMVGMRSDAPGPARPVFGVWRRGYPPVLPGGLCAGGRGFARNGHYDDCLLAWYRSHGRDRADAVTMLTLLRLTSPEQDADACPLTPLQATLLARAAMDRVIRGVGDDGGQVRRVRAGNGWRRPFNATDAGMRAEVFTVGRDALAYWLMQRIVCAERAYWSAVSARESEAPAESYNRSRRSHSVHYPARPNCLLRKANPAPEMAFEFDQAA